MPVSGKYINKLKYGNQANGGDAPVHFGIYHGRLRDF